ncbi:MAG TPA: hypothetical protein VMO20_01120 [Candidatus Acidoferrum sp.]|nr:hypothetical protein [Candidatus Acidoferrum sp.]
MTSPLEIPGPSEIGRLLRGETEIISDWSGRWVTGRFLLHLAVIILGAGLYGATMGWWRAPQQALFVAIKFPLIILMVTAGNALINGLLAPLLGLGIRFYQSFSAIVMSFTVTSAILGAFSPVMAFLIWNAPAMTSNISSQPTYRIILLAHVAVIALAGTAGNIRLLQLLVLWSGSRAIAMRVLTAWLTGNLFLGTQLTWILRPFIGSPNLPVAFLRANAFHGNFYETIFRSFQQIFTQ